MQRIECESERSLNAASGADRARLSLLPRLATNLRDAVEVLLRECHRRKNSQAQKALPQLPKTQATAAIYVQDLQN